MDLAVSSSAGRFGEYRILLIDDNRADVEIIRQGLLRTGAEHDVHVAGNGEQALAMLRRPENPLRPNLILLDLDMPVMGGHAFLAEVKRDPDLRWIPIVILSSSDSDEDIKMAYRQSCNAYLIKPVEFDRLVEIIRVNCAFWFRHARLPGGGAS